MRKRYIGLLTTFTGFAAGLCAGWSIGEHSWLPLIPGVIFGIVSGSRAGQIDAELEQS